MLSLGSRRTIFEFVRRRPGSHLREISRSLALPLGTTLYHLECLQHAGRVVARRDGRFKRFFERHALGRHEKEFVSALHRDVPRRIVDELVATGAALTQRELCAALGVSRSTLSFHVNSLAEKGILVREERMPENTYALADPRRASDMVALFRGEAPARPNEISQLLVES